MISYEVMAKGATPNTSMFKFILPTALGSHDYVQVESTLQVRGHPTIFAAGDITNMPEAKQLAKTPGHAAVVVANIMSYLKEEQPRKECKPGKEMIIVSNGRVSCEIYTVLFSALFENKLIDFIFIL
jgi:NADH dehydrogenase FAD-containing subunit